jgi:alpha-tubulin suppressor-like RCC1 family protein
MGSAISLIAVRNAVFRAISMRELVGLFVGLTLLTFASSASAASPAVVSAWGDNTYGQLGDGYEGWDYDSKVPVPVSGLSGAKSVAASGSAGLALMQDGTVMGWGNNGAGELGDGTITQRDTPVAVKGLSGVKQIAAGSQDSYALLENGTVEAWGYDNLDQLGPITPTEICESGAACVRRPTPVPGLAGVKAIAAGESYALALLENGTVEAWGEGSWGQLGNGPIIGLEICPEEPAVEGSRLCSKTPVTVSGLSAVGAIAAGHGDSLALLENSTVVSWGYNGAGQLGAGSTEGPEWCVNGVSCSGAPVAVSGLSGVTQVSAGDLHNLALLSGGTVEAWGNDEAGQLGNGGFRESDVPVAVKGLTGVTAISAGDYHSLALLSDGTVEAWGWDELWQLGNIETEGQSRVPVPMNGLSGVTAIAAGNGQSYAVGATPVAYPQIAKLAPYTGPEAGGTAVTITGINFTGATAVDFGSKSATSFTVDSPTSITAVSPAGAKGKVEVTVTTTEGTSYTSPRDTFSYGEEEAAEKPEKESPHEGPGEPGEKLVVSDESAANITEHAATIKADVNPQRTTEITYFVQYGTTTSYGASAPNPPETVRWATCGLECEGEAETPRPVSVNLTELQANTTYHYRVVASNGSGVEHYGQDATFTTGSSGAKPTIEGVSVSGITEHDATLEAQIDPNGLATTYQFRLGKGCYPAICDVIVDISLPEGNLSSAQGAQSVSLDLNSVGVSLQPNSMYYYSVVATNSAGEAGGNEGTFRTPPEPTGENGGAETGAASKISQTGATLGGVVTAWGWREATYVFEYGTTTSYGQSAPTPPGVIGLRATCGLPCGPPHSEQFTVSENLAGLQPKTTYHYRLVSTSNGHTSFGNDATFTTHDGGFEPLNTAAPSPAGGGESPSQTGGSGQSGNSSTLTGSGASLTPGVFPLVSTVAPKVGPVAQKLARALKACKKKPRNKRAACAKQARKAYATAAKKSK